MKVTIFQNIPSFYRSSVFLALSKKVDLRVYYFSHSQKERYWMQDKSVISGLDAVKYNFMSGFNIDIPGIPDGRIVDNKTFITDDFGDVCVLIGYASIADWQALLWLKLLGYRIVLWYGSTIKTHKINAKSPLGIIKKIFLSNVDSFVTYGTEATKSLIEQGVSSDKIITGCNVTDIDFFKSQVRPIREANTPFRWFYSGQLIYRKGLDLFLDTISSMSDLPEWKLTVAGTGSMLEEYKAKVVANGLAERVTFLGNQSYEELRNHYLASDAFVFLSREEVWGLVANEAIHCGCPILASDQAGATPDIIIDGINGIVCNIKDMKNIANGIRSMMREKWDSNKIRNSLSWATPSYQSAKIIEACHLSLK
jgi:glycosyltransferase involved in cell wall biosynthesis